MFYLLLLIGYCVGSIPFGFLIGKGILGVDIRTKGSGNIGMTNVMRVGGKLPGILTFLMDFAKGGVMMAIARPWLLDESGSVLVFQWSCLGIALVCGHIYSIFLKLKGGKGISTLFGVLAVLHLPVGLVSALVWVGVFLVKRISSLAALVMLTLLPFLFLIIPWGMEKTISFPQCLLFCGLSALLIYRHRENIARLLKGEEKQLNIFQKSN